MTKPIKQCTCRIMTSHDHCLYVNSKIITELKAQSLIIQMGQKYFPIKDGMNDLIAASRMFLEPAPFPRVTSRSFRMPRS